MQVGLAHGLDRSPSPWFVEVHAGWWYIDTGSFSDEWLFALISLLVGCHPACRLPENAASDTCLPETRQNSLDGFVAVCPSALLVAGRTAEAIAEWEAAKYRRERMLWAMHECVVSATLHDPLTALLPAPVASANASMTSE